MLLLERGANIEEVNDEGYTPLMEASREGHEEMVALLLSQGADINAQTEETQETALTLACCGGRGSIFELHIGKYYLARQSETSEKIGKVLAEISQKDYI